MSKILTCPHCGAVVLPEESGGMCPQCRVRIAGPDGEPLPAQVGRGTDETRLAPLPTAAADVDPTPPARPVPSSASSPISSSSGWLASSGSIDHGRFQPGSILGGRYRVLGRLGKGGMGEVYRADDLKLGQPVALKFLPADVDRDPARLTQLHTEVRMARQVAHPNVCRVYDIDETDGHTFLSMEYVDGEDFGSLLKRIGRFPQDRAIEVARQICSGLAAAHERGVIHRDFKPANVMLDSAGKSASLTLDWLVRPVRSCVRARQLTWRPNRSRAQRSPHAVTSTPSGSCSTKSSPGSVRSKARTSRS